jgi:CRISPR-associated exonuclease Cas4
MSEQPISISILNDFIFCPASIYFHSLDSDTESLMIQDSFQLNGTASHEKSDKAAYSTKKSMLQGIPIYSDKYNLCGKIDTFDSEKGILTERKKKIKTVYDGYIFQLYAQYFSLKEMGYVVKEIRLFSMDDNKVFKIDLPEINKDMYLKFKNLIYNIGKFSFDGFRQENKLKCMHCIYEPLCSYSAIKDCESNDY